MAKPKTRPYTDTKVIDAEQHAAAIEEFLKGKVSDDDREQIATAVAVKDIDTAKALGFCLLKGEHDKECLRELLYCPEYVWFGGKKTLKDLPQAA